MTEADLVKVCRTIQVAVVEVVASKRAQAVASTTAKVVVAAGKRAKAVASTTAAKAATTARFAAEKARAAAKAEPDAEAAKLERKRVDVRRAAEARVRLDEPPSDL